MEMERRYELIMERKEALRTEKEYLQKLLDALEVCVLLLLARALLQSDLG